MSDTAPTDMCPVCGTQESRVIWRQREPRYTGQHCTSCGLVWIAEGEGADNDLYTEAYYAENYVAREAERMRYIETIVLPRIADVLQSGAAQQGVLDVGCGVGHYVRAFRNRGLPVMGVEPAPSARDRAHAGGVEVVADLREVGERRFGLITLFDVLAHVSEPVPFLDALAGLLSPGGRLVLTTPYRPASVFRAAGILSPLMDTDWLVHVPYQHHHFTQAPLRRILARHFEVNRIDLMPEVGPDRGRTFGPFSRTVRETVKSALRRTVYLPRIDQQATKLLAVATVRAE